MDAPTIESLRVALDVYDAHLLDLLRRRSLVVRDIHALKDAGGLPPVDADREAAILARVTGAGNSTRYSDATVAAVFKAIMAGARETTDDR